MRSWPRVVIRTFAVLNMLLGIEGLLALLISAYARVRADPWPQDPPYFAEAYYLQAVINLALALITAWAAPYLWRLQERGRTMCNVLFCGEIVYFWATSLFFAFSFLFHGKESAFCHALAVSGGAGNMGIGLQLATAYPLVGIVLINLAYRRLGGPTPVVKFSSQGL